MHAHIPQAARAFTIAELLVVIGLIAFLIGIILPLVSSAREAANQTACASNMRQVAQALHLYSHDHHGWILRDTTLNQPAHESWILAVARAASSNKEVSEDILPAIAWLQCPSHPRSDIPSAFIINGFQTEINSMFRWTPAGAMKLSGVRRSSELILLGEAPDEFANVEFSLAPSSAITAIELHDVWRPEHLPRQFGERITDSRHGHGANVAFFDSHVETRKSGEITLRDFLQRLPTR